jgi:hypothetical protein
VRVFVSSSWQRTYPSLSTLRLPLPWCVCWQVAYGEFRDGFDKDKYDRRLVFYGMRYIIDNYVNRQWTMRDVDCVAKFYSTHNAPFFSDYPFPKELFQKFVRVVVFLAFP